MNTIYSLDPTLSVDEIQKDLAKGFNLAETRTKAKIIKVIGDNPGITREDLWLDHFGQYAGSTIRNYLTDLMKTEIVVNLSDEKTAKYYLWRAEA